MHPGVTGVTRARRFFGSNIASSTGSLCAAFMQDTDPRLVCSTGPRLIDDRKNLAISGSECRMPFVHVILLSHVCGERPDEWSLAPGFEHDSVHSRRSHGTRSEVGVTRRCVPCLLWHGYQRVSRDESSSRRIGAQSLTPLVEIANRQFQNGESLAGSASPSRSAANSRSCQSSVNARSPSRRATPLWELGVSGTPAIPR